MRLPHPLRRTPHTFRGPMGRSTQSRPSTPFFRQANFPNLSSSPSSLFTISPSASSSSSAPPPCHHPLASIFGMAFSPGGFSRGPPRGPEMARQLVEDFCLPPIRPRSPVPGWWLQRPRELRRHSGRELGARVFQDMQRLPRRLPGSILNLWSLILPHFVAGAWTSSPRGPLVADARPPRGTLRALLPIPLRGVSGPRALSSFGPLRRQLRQPYGQPHHVWSRLLVARHPVAVRHRA